MGDTRWREHGCRGDEGYKFQSREMCPVPISSNSHNHLYPKWRKNKHYSCCTDNAWTHKEKVPGRAPNGNYYVYRFKCRTGRKFGHLICMKGGNGDIHWRGLQRLCLPFQQYDCKKE